MRATLKLTCDIKDLARTLAALLEEIKVHQIEDELANKLDICVHRLRGHHLSDNPSQYWEVIGLIDQIRQRLALIDVSLMEKSMMLEGFIRGPTEEQAPPDNKLEQQDSPNVVNGPDNTIDEQDNSFEDLEIIASD